jgi:hypothetical protein
VAGRRRFVVSTAFVSAALSLQELTGIGPSLAKAAARLDHQRFCQNTSQLKERSRCSMHQIQRSM